VEPLGSRLAPLATGGLYFAAMDRFPGFELPDELVLLREQVHRFIRDEILPLEARLDPDAADIPEEDYRRLSAKTKTSGLWCLGAPEEYGGGGLARWACASCSRRWRSTRCSGLQR
jgi:alkylation response protein AidB-like acyl-CoA dehydrogenase